MRGHARRLRLDTTHIDQPDRPGPAKPVIADHIPAGSLRESGALFAATWFALRGATISWPLEPCRYDLLVDVHSTLHRIQVKTTSGCGPGAVVTLATSRRRGSTVYAPGEIDSFFLIDAELSAYLVPYDVVAGFSRVQLGRYANFVIVDRGRLIPASACASPGP